MTKKLRHIANVNYIKRALLEGVPVTGLCGEIFQPSKKTYAKRSKRPTCLECLRVHSAMRVTSQAEPLLDLKTAQEVIDYRTPPPLYFTYSITSSTTWTGKPDDKENR